MYLVPDLMAWKQDAFEHPWKDLGAYAFTPFALLRHVFSSVIISTYLLILVAPLRPQKEWFTDMLALLLDEPLELPLL